MIDLVHSNLAHFVAAALLVSRLGDVISTYLLTPSLELEANPIVRRLGWKFAVASILICLVPYLDIGVGVAILVPFLLVSASNTGKIWFVRTLGEERYKAMLLETARRGKQGHAVGGAIVSSSFIVLLGIVAMILSPDLTKDWGYWIGTGIVAYGIVIAFYGILFVRKLFREAAEAPAAEGRPSAGGEAAGPG